MSKFFSVLNNVSGGEGQIDDVNISTDSTYSSFEINKLLNDLASMLIGCAFLEYPADIRTSPQKIFETPNSSHKSAMWVLREGVKMTEGIDYTVTDDTHIEFTEDVSEKYTVSILFIGKGAASSSTGTGGIISTTSPVPTVFLQNTPTNSWQVNHKAGFKYPKLTVVDENDNEINDLVNIQYIDENNCIITSEIPFMGKCIVY